MYTRELENHKYFEVMQNYIAKIEGTLNNQIINGGGQYRAILKKVYNFYIFSSYLTNYFKNKKLYAIDEQNSLNILNCKASLNLFGIYNCLKSGLEQEASIIFRSLYESYITMYFILQKDVGLRMKLYYNFSKVERRNNIVNNENLLKRGLIKSLVISNEEKEFHLKEYEKVKEDYHPKYPYEWTWKIFKVKEKSKNPSLYDLCKELGEKYEVEYTKTFSVHSISVHGGAILEDAFRVENSDKDVIANIPKYTSGILNLGAMSINYYGKIIEKHLDFFKVDDYKSIKDFVELYALEALHTRL